MKKLGPFTFVIDRPKGTVKEWPQPDGSVKRFVYPCDYGYWPKIKGEDGEGLDAFVGDDPDGHKESFQKLNPDGTLDETKFLLGVSDAERETIYGLYKREVHARRVYEDWDDVRDALDSFQTKRHKTAEHKHRWEYGYLPGTGYRHCACGAIEEVFPEGPPKPMPEKLCGFIRRHLQKVAATPEQIEAAKSLLADPNFVWHGTNSPSDGAASGKVRYGGGLDVYGRGVYTASRPEPTYWSSAGYAIPKAHLDKRHAEFQYNKNTKWQVNPRDITLRDGAVAFVPPASFEEAKKHFSARGVNVLPLDALHHARGDHGAAATAARLDPAKFGPLTPARRQSAQSVISDVVPWVTTGLSVAAPALRDYKMHKEAPGVSPYKKDGFRISPATLGGAAGAVLGYGASRILGNKNPLVGAFGLRSHAASAALASSLGMGLGSTLDSRRERGVWLKQLEDASRSGADVAPAASIISDPSAIRATANAALRRTRGQEIDDDPGIVPEDVDALSDSIKDPERRVSFFAEQKTPVDKMYREWVRAGRPEGRDYGLYLGKKKTAAYLFGVKLAMDPFATLNWVPSGFAGRVQTPGQILQTAQTTPALAGTQENIRMLQLSQDPFAAGQPTPQVHHRHRRHHG